MWNSMLITNGVQYDSWSWNDKPRRHYFVWVNYREVNMQWETDVEDCGCGRSSDCHCESWVYNVLMAETTVLQLCHPINPHMVIEGGKSTPIPIFWTPLLNRLELTGTLLKYVGATKWPIFGNSNTTCKVKMAAAMQRLYLFFHIDNL